MEKTVPIQRELDRSEIELVWTIDRSEYIQNVYHLERGELVLKPEVYQMNGWPPGESEMYTPILLGCYDRGGWFYGVFEDSRLIAVAILDIVFIGKDRDLIQLKFLHVSHGYRKSGLGKKLLMFSLYMAKKKGAAGLYISATPSENTVNFYLSQGCVLTPQPDPDLYALEPDDIHLECRI